MRAWIAPCCRSRCSRPRHGALPARSPPRCGRCAARRGASGDRPARACTSPIGSSASPGTGRGERRPREPPSSTGRRATDILFARIERRTDRMSGVRVLVGTRKGAFVLTADGKRKSWDVSGPHFPGWEIYHVKGSPADPNRIYASQSSGWFGQVTQRSSDGGKTWETVGNKFTYDGVPGTHQWYDGTQHPWEFKRVWHLEPSLTDPDTVYAGVEDAGLFRSTDGGQTWQELGALRAAKGHLWQPGAGGMCLHTIVLDPRDSKRISVAISAAGVFQTDDAGKSWRPANCGLKSPYQLPDSTAEVGHCVHRIAMHPSRPNVFFMQKHWDVMRSDDGGANWQEIRDRKSTRLNSSHPSI